jgi:hypothetical protein
MYLCYMLSSQTSHFSTHPFKMASSTCSVCCEDFNRAARKEVTCKFCEFKACTECVKVYFCSEDNASDAHCMACKKAWTREVISEFLPKTWINGSFKKHREVVLMDREKSMLPATQVYVKEELDRRKMREETKRLQEEKKMVKERLREINEALYLQQNIMYNSMRGAAHQACSIIKGACPKDGCRGFLNNSWKCDICTTQVCGKCRMEKGDDHECKPEDVETAAFIAKDAKACPCCGALCHKVDGCSQVFCVMCKTAFNYNTLRIETGHIHAPDYYRWVADNNNGIVPRNPGDNPCRDNVTVYELRQHLKQVSGGSVFMQWFCDVHRIRTHIQGHELYKYVVNVEEDNRDLRVKFLLNEIDEDKWKRLLQQREKAKDKKREIHAVLDTFIAVSLDIFHAVMDANDKNKLDQCVESFGQLRDFMHERMSKISLMFNCVVPKITNDWNSVVNVFGDRELDYESDEELV